MMKRLFAWLMAAAFFSPLAAVAQETPNALIQRLSTDVLDRIKADKEIQAGNPRRVNELVDNVVMPHVNFQRMTALAVGRHWRAATPEQQKQLMNEFRTLLLRTYSGALSQVGNQQVRLKPLRANDGDNEVIVRSEVVQPRGEPVQLDYRMERASDGWKIYDVNVAGVWLVETYRNQFGQEIQAKGIDGLLKDLSEKNRSFEQGDGAASPRRS